MTKVEERFVRLFILFDLPTSTKQERKQASHFRKSLIKNGFMMLQFSVYVRVCKGSEIANKYSAIVNNHLPNKGNVRLLQITDKQYSRMQILIGESKPAEKHVGAKQLLIF